MTDFTRKKEFTVWLNQLLHQGLAQREDNPQIQRIDNHTMYVGSENVMFIYFKNGRQVQIRITQDKVGH